MITAYLMNCRSLPDPTEQMLAGLARARAEKILRLKQPQARRLSFGAGLLLEALLPGPYLDELRVNPYGRPWHEKIAFSISHSGDYALVSMEEPVGEGEEICLLGCDIERVREYREGVARRFFTEQEYQLLSQMTDNEAKARQFYRCWTRKESVLKLTGLGMALPLELFDVAGSRVSCAPGLAAWAAGQTFQLQGERALTFQAALEMLRRPLFFQEYAYDGYLISVCSDKEEFSREICIKKACIAGHDVIS